MTAQWVKYNGSDEQIAEMYFAEDGFMAKNINNSVSSVMSVKFNQLFIQDQKEPYLPGLFGNSLENFLSYNNTIEYLICEPHPLADMICQWARTGQPVWVRYAKVCHFGQTSEYEICNQIATPTPDWNIPGAEYSFTPFDKDAKIKLKSRHIGLDSYDPSSPNGYD